MMRRELHFLAFVPKTHNCNLNYEKDIRKIPLRDFLQNTCPVLLKTVKIMKNKGKMRNS